MKSIWILILCICFGGILEAQSKKSIKFINDYQSVAHPEFNGDLLAIRKWHQRDTLTYAIIGTLEYTNQKGLMKFFKKLEPLTEMVFVRTAELDDADISIHFESIKDYLTKIGKEEQIPMTLNFDNWTSRRYGPDKKMKRASFCIDPSKVKKTSRGLWLLKHGIVKALGLQGESQSQYSLFYRVNTDFNRTLKKDDKRIIKMHYSEHIQPNMTFDEVSRTLTTEVDVDAFLKSKI